jgi:hypothetical protein
MAEMDDLQNLGGDVGPPQHRFLLVPFSGTPDIVPRPGIGSARLTLSNDAVDNIVHDILVSFTYSVRAAVVRFGSLFCIFGTIEAIVKP